MPPRSIPASHFRTVARGRSPDQIDPSELLSGAVAKPVPAPATHARKPQRTPQAQPQEPPPARVKAKAQPRKPGTMNGLERAWAMELDRQREKGEILSWRYERVTFKLAPDLRITPDFMVVLPDGTIRFDETKGFMREDARAKVLTVADMFPEFTFRLVRRVKGQWVIVEL